MGSTDINIENIPTVRTLLGCSLGLITVEASSSTARLVHFSLQEYISNNPGLFQSPHSMIAEVCLTYLNFQCVRELSPTISSPPSTVPLVGYASIYWGKHMGREKANSVNPFSLGLLVEFERHIASQLLLLSYYEDICDTRWWEQGFDERGGPKGFTGLHAAAFFGLVEIVAALLAMKKWDISAPDITGKTALTWAAVRGHADVVLLLLEEDINPNPIGTRYWQAPLLLATGSGHEGIVKLLLEREDIDPNTADTKYGLTPLILAAISGHEGIVKLLLEQEDINPNTAEKYGETPLLAAAAGGHEGIVKLLLEREDINPNTAGGMVGQTPLASAAQGGHAGTVKLLLGRGDINPNLGARFGRTPLFSATRGGYERIVELLLQREDTNPNTIDLYYGHTPLLVAAINGYEGVTKLLLGREDIDPDTADTEYGRTLLAWAAKHGHTGVVELLSGRGDVNPTQHIPAAKRVSN